MRKSAVGGAIIALVGIAAQASAQNITYWSAPISASQSAQSAYFPMGTPLMLTTRTQVSTKENKPGDRLYLDVAESLSYRGQVVIPAGSVAVAEVARSDRNGHFGKKGKIDVHLLYVETPSGPIRLSGTSYDEGTSGTITSVVTIAFVSWLGFLVHGTSAHIPFGTPVKAYLAEDMRFALPNSATRVAMAQPDAPRALPAHFDAQVQTAQR